MSNWISVDQVSANTPLEQRSGCGVDLQVFVSPYDVPSAIRGGFDDSLKKMMIQFKYMTPEEDMVQQQADKYVQFFVGKESNRLHKILVDVDSLKADRLKVTVLSMVEEAIDRLANKPLRPQRRGNYIAAKRALEQHQGLLVGAGS